MNFPIKMGVSLLNEDNILKWIENYFLLLQPHSVLSGVLDSLSDIDWQLSPYLFSGLAGGLFPIGCSFRVRSANCASVILITYSLHALLLPLIKLLTPIFLFYLYFSECPILLNRK